MEPVSVAFAKLPASQVQLRRICTASPGDNWWLLQGLLHGLVSHSFTIYTQIPLSLHEQIHRVQYVHLWSDRSCHVRIVHPWTDWESFGVNKNLLGATEAERLFGRDVQINSDKESQRSIFRDYLSNKSVLRGFQKQISHSIWSEAKHSNLWEEWDYLYTSIYCVDLASLRS